MSRCKEKRVRPDGHNGMEGLDELDFVRRAAFVDMNDCSARDFRERFSLAGGKSRSIGPT
jgi:hypothetical protein